MDKLRMRLAKQVGLAIKAVPTTTMSKMVVRKFVIRSGNQITRCRYSWILEHSKMIVDPN